MLPRIGNTISHPRPNHLSNAIDLSQAAPIFRGTPTNTEHAALRGNAQWNQRVNTLQVSQLGWWNYLYIPPIRSKVSYGVLPSQGVDTDFYVISDRFGGCEYHTLYNQRMKMFAFLHIFREGGITQAYQLADGWVLQNRQCSSPLARKKGTSGMGIFSISHIQRSANAPVAQSRFIHLGNNMEVTEVDDGNCD